MYSRARPPIGIVNYQSYSDVNYINTARPSIWPELLSGAEQAERYMQVYGEDGAFSKWWTQPDGYY